ncbi:MAG TPA: glycoside hydrolase family 16 protein [Nocardioides sp.]|nr:glycoside hydrolase family 16 protein [Nocardioides sp.]
MRSPLPVQRRRRVAAALATVALAAAAVVSLPGTSATAAAFRPSGDSCGTTLYKADGSAWSCSFVDNFSGTRLDTTKWTIGETATSGFFVGNTCLTANNVAVGGGELRLTARDTGQSFTCPTAAGGFTTRYTGGHIGTVGHFSQTYGRFEVRSRYPQSSSGLTANFWMYPDKQTYGAWPSSGEIDVSEWWSSSPTQVLPTLHYSGSTFAGDSGWGCTVADPTTWHTYTLVWQPTQMQFSIDGTTCFTDSWTPNAPLVAPQPFDKPFSMLLTMAAGGASGADAVSASTTFPATYEVDYAKAWK